MNRLIVLTPTLIAFVLLAAGCGKSNPRADLDGVVNYKGAPLGGGSITLHTKQGLYGPKPIGPDGRYEFHQLPVGEADVSIETESANTIQRPTYGGGKQMQSSLDAMTKEKPELKGGPAPKIEYKKIPPKYSLPTTSGLKIDLKPGKQTKNWDLAD